MLPPTGTSQAPAPCLSIIMQLEENLLYTQACHIMGMNGCSSKQQKISKVLKKVGNSVPALPLGSEQPLQREQHGAEMSLQSSGGLSRTWRMWAFLLQPYFTFARLLWNACGFRLVGHSLKSDHNANTVSKLSFLMQSAAAGQSAYLLYRLMQQSTPTSALPAASSFWQDLHLYHSVGRPSKGELKTHWPILAPRE